MTAGVLVLVALLLFGILLIPSYYRNWQFQGFLDETVESNGNLNRPAEMLRVDVSNRAAQIGLPVRPDQVQIVQAPNRLKIQVSYFVRVDLPLYTVDLHFHPDASR
jgi:hypothetical protein